MEAEAPATGVGPRRWVPALDPGGPGSGSGRGRAEAPVEAGRRRAEDRVEPAAARTRWAIECCS